MEWAAYKQNKEHLSRLREFLVFKVLGMNQFEHGVSKQEWVLTVVEAPRHLVKVGR